ncbi:MAG: sodium:proton antiporter, partial [Pseudohongiella sp.]
MTFDIALVLTILLVAVLLFATEKLRMDVVALLVLCALAVTGLVSPEEAIAGFSHPAVVTIWAMFILSDGLTRAGIADMMGQRVIRVAGDSEMALVITFMLLAGLLSAFMNNIGVTALLLPVVVGVARQVGATPSRLLMPMAFGCLLGGALTIIGTPPNLLVSTALQEAGFEGFGFFDFAPIAVPVLLVGTAFVALVGRHWLPARDPVAEIGDSRDLRELYSLQERIFAVQVPEESLLVGKSLGEAGLTTAAGLMIIALSRGGHTQALPSSVTRLQAGDILLAQGRLDRFKLLRQWSELSIEREAPVLHDRLLEDAGLYEVTVSDDSALAGKSMTAAEFYESTQSWLLAVLSGETVRRTRLSDYTFVSGDQLLIQGDEKVLKALCDKFKFIGVTALDKERVLQKYHLDERLLVLKVPKDAALAGRSVGDSRLGKAFDLRLLAMFRDGDFIRPLPADEEIKGG